MTPTYDLAVVGLGPAGRAIAHRALAAGLRVAVVARDPDVVWSATFGVYTADLPHWFDHSVIAAAAASITVFTPAERVVPHGYAILDTAAFQRALTLDGADVHAGTAVHVTGTVVTCSDGIAVRARHVIDARGAVAADQAGRPRQTAVGAVVESDDPTMVLMDWRPVAPDGDAASFDYRVALGAGRRLVEETCLAGAPPLDVEVLTDRNRRRHGHRSTDEIVDFPLYSDATPWRRTSDAPLTFGAGGGLMNPATGYSVGHSLQAADLVIAAILDDRDPYGALWSRRARLAYRLRILGLGVLVTLDAAELIAFFDAFFRIDPDLQSRYLSGRDDACGVLRAMAAVYAALTMRMRARVAIGCLPRPGRRRPAARRGRVRVRGRGRRR